jgi:hypothetical protein
VVTNSREREKSVEKKLPTGGSHPTVRERGERGWAGSSRAGSASLGPGHGPGGLMPLFLFCFLFLLFSILLI